MKVRYYSTQRPVTPGSYPKDGAVYIENYSQPNFFHEIGGTAWGFIDYDRELTEQEISDYELTAEGKRWCSVIVGAMKHGGTMRAWVDKKTVISIERPSDERYMHGEVEYKRRYFYDIEEAMRVAEVLNSIEITTERVRMSATQGEVRVYINGEYILNFADDIVFVRDGEDRAKYYGKKIGDYMSISPDSSFVLGLIWHPLEHAYHYAEKICKALGIEPEEWIGG